MVYQREMIAEQREKNTSDVENNFEQKRLPKGSRQESLHVYK